MNTIITSKEAILSECKEFVAQNGLPALNMRSLAKKCNVSVGSLYHYFPSKSELISAVVQDIWKELFSIHKEEALSSFPEYIEWLFKQARIGTMNYPNFFMVHSISFAEMDKTRAKQVMETYFQHMKRSMLAMLDQDKRVLSERFSEEFTKEEFVNFVFQNLLSLLTQQQNSCKTLLKVIQHCLY